MASIFQNQEGGAWSVQFYLGKNKRKKIRSENPSKTGREANG